MPMTPHQVRSVRATALLYCEGAHDIAFVKHLIQSYSNTGSLRTKFRTRQGKGGSPDILVVEAMSVPGDFDRRLVKADKDRPEEETERAEQLALTNNIEIAWSEPCIEALLLKIVEEKDYSTTESKNCKKVFESKYIKSSKRADPRSYALLFTKDVLDEARNRIPELDQLINFITS